MIKPITKQLSKLAITGLLPLFAACSGSIKLEGISQLQFEEDVFGCKGYRLSVRAALDGQTDKLKGLSEPEIVNTLGQPDQKNLGGRSQKYFKYYIADAPKCTGDTVKRADVLLVRFNALNRVSEASLGVDVR